jgi:hypothetical protein
MERENLAGDGKGKGTSGSNREAESTDAPERGGLPRLDHRRSDRPQDERLCWQTEIMHKPGTPAAADLLRP